MITEDLLKEKREEILQVAAKHGAHNVRIFGSVARGEARENSDIDFLVEFENGRSLLDHAALMLELQKILSCDVDIITERALRPRIRERIMHDLVSL